jgi:hypothetical protein
VRWFAPALAWAVVAVVAVACGSNPRDVLVIHYDAGSDARVDAPAAGEAGSVDAGDTADANPNLGGPCVDNTQCDDSIPCTYDSCDKTLKRCLNVPDDTQCDNHIYCDGQEVCVLRQGCQAGPPVSCDDSDPCKIAACVESTRSCVYKERDVDQDGDPDARCAPGHDCNDLDPAVSSLVAEICGNGVDDNCNGLIDEQPCVTPQGNSCANATPIAGAGAFALSTIGATKTFTTSCSVPTTESAQDVVAAITVPQGLPVDLELWATAQGSPVAIAVDSMCGQPTTEIACGTSGSSARVRARSVSPGTYYAVVTTQTPGSVELKVALLAPTPKATNVDCASAIDVQPGASTTVQIVDPPSNLTSSCLANTGALTYAFTLTAPEDVRIYASTLVGSGVPVIGLRDPTCTGSGDEIACILAGGMPLYQRSLAPGRYVVTVAGSAPIDASFEVQLSAPTTPPPDETCTAPPTVSANQLIAFDLANHEQAIDDSCGPPGPHAAYDLSLAKPSDVLLIGHFAQDVDTGSVALDTPACDKKTRLTCDMEVSPVRAGVRNVAAGDYRTVVADSLGLQGTLDVLVRDTVAPNNLAPKAADTCAQAIDASAGGFFTGNTSTANADYSNGCDTPSSLGGGAPEQVLSLQLPKAQRVVLDAEGSAYPTILDVRQGPGCPGDPIVNACSPGLGPQRSFLDLELAAGEYWILIDGYGGNSGMWDLDVRILPP